MRLEDKVVVVTGGGGGIGRAICQGCAREGARVAIGEIVPEAGQAVVDEIEAAGGQALSVPVDVADTAQIDGLFDRALAAYGRIDVMVNNAYGSPESLSGDGDLLSVPGDAWDRVMQTTLKSVFHASQRAVAEMVKTGGGSVVNMSSVNGTHAFGMVAYSSAKGAIIAMTRCASVQYASQGVRMNVICPGTIATASTVPFMEQVPGLREKTEAMYPCKRLGTPEEVANVALFLASDESSFVNGAVFTVDGGVTVGPPSFALVDEMEKVDWQRPS